jgi:hypothetical protein
VCVTLPFRREPDPLASDTPLVAEASPDASYAQPSGVRA